jgi:hypothetical protein
MMKDERED